MINLSGTGAFSQPVSTTTNDYRQNSTIEVTLQDSSPAGRGSDVERRTDRSGEPPAPSLSVTRGGRCTDGDSDPNNNCKQNPTMPVCDTASCGYVHYNVSGFLNDYSCSVFSPEAPGRWFGQSFSHPAGSVVDQETNWYYGSGTVTVTCSALTGYQQSVSTPYVWPP